MSGLIPRPFIDELLNRTDIVELIDDYVPLKKAGKDYLACCPFHNEKTPSFNVIPNKQFYHCFGCGASGSAISFLMNYLNLGFVEAIEKMADRLGLDVPREGKTQEPKISPSLYDLLAQVSKFYQQALKTSGQQAIEYLKNRQLNGEIVKLYGIGYAPSGWHSLEQHFKHSVKDLLTTGMLIQKEEGGTYDRYRHRITFPIHDRHGRIIGFGGRAIDKDQKPKYLNSPETPLFQKSRELYGLHQAIQEQSPMPYIIVVEGYMDVIALAQHGIRNAVATLGTATSLHHIQLLNKHTKKIVFCFDGDAAGRKAAWRALESTLSILNSGLEALFCFLPKEHDPDSLIRQEGKDSFLNNIQSATPFHQFFLAHLMEDMDCTSLAGKSQLINAAKPYLAKMGEGPYHQLLIDELSRLTRIDSHRVSQLLAENSQGPILDSNSHISRTPTRVAIALLIQHPELYEQCANKLSTIVLEDPNQTMIKKLMEQIRETPGINTASLVESWRDTQVFDALAKLATWDTQVPDNALEKEFLDTILFLSKRTHEKKIADLLEKSRNGGLTDIDRLELQKLLKQKHQNVLGENLE